MKKESLFAIFHYEIESENIIDDLAIYFDMNAEDIVSFFGIEEMPFKVEINIIPTKEEFDKLFKEEFGFETNKSSRGICKRDGSINFLSINDYKNTSHAFNDNDYNYALIDFKKTLVHEFVHVVNKVFNKENKCTFSSTYLFEGLAVYLSKQKDNQKFSFDFSIDDLLTKDNSKRKYYAYYLIVKFLVENYDKSLVFELLKDKYYAEKFLKDELYNKAQKFYNRNVKL